MRLAALALSAAALSGCSWLGGHHATHHAGYQAGCVPGGYGQVGGFQGSYQGGYGLAQADPCLNGSYGVQQAGYGTGFQNYYGAGSTQGFAGQSYTAPGYAASAAAPGYGATTYGATTYGATTLGAAAPFGAAVQGQFAQGQFGASYAQAPAVQTVVGAPIYAPQPYPAPYPVPLPPGSPCCGGVGGGAMPFGLEGFVGTDFNADGDLFTKKSEGPPDGDFSIGTRVGSIENISYGDAFGQTKTVGGALTYDLSHNLTALASAGFSRSEGQTVEEYTTVQDGTWAGGVFTPAVGSTERALDGTFTDLETVTLEAGLRQYYGHPHGLRPYLGASAGFVHNNEVEFTQTYSDTGGVYGGRTFVESGWSPTASATLGAEVPVGPMAAVGFETGLRWTDNMDTPAASEDRITIPLTLRGRLSF
ncbi:MAG: hypothetical protein AAF311_12835 [Pseudomonadota bacterium]